MKAPAACFIWETGGTAVSAAAGLLVRAFSPELAGTALPWDAAWPFYSSAFFATGLIVAKSRIACGHA